MIWHCLTVHLQDRYKVQGSKSSLNIILASSSPCRILKYLCLACLLLPLFFANKLVTYLTTPFWRRTHPWVFPWELNSRQKKWTSLPGSGQKRPLFTSPCLQIEASGTRRRSRSPSLSEETDDGVPLSVQVKPWTPMHAHRRSPYD